MKFGPQIVEVTGTLFRHHLRWVLGAVLLGALIWLGARRPWKARTTPRQKGAEPERNS